MKFGTMLTALLLSVCAMGQSSLYGTITSNQGEPLVGTNVWLEGTNYAAATDVDGNYRITNIADGTYRLKVSYVGFESFTDQLPIDEDVRLDISLKESVIKGEEVIVYATRANEKTPTTYSNISSEEIEKRNLGQDIPFVLRYTPSMVVTSDAGNGVGYTGIRIRGSDPTRINVTVNGIPLNDSESHGTFWVNMPDFTSSVDNIQIQRGVGTSTNGAAAFGASVNLQTDMPDQDAYASINNSFGSFNTWKNTVELNSGLINNRWTFQGRLSRIASDGYIDRASSDLKSYYLSGGYYGKKTTIKALTFSGKEVTYQSWYGTPEAKLYGDDEDLKSVVDFGGEYSTQEELDNLFESGRTFNYYLYDREVDNYGQDHYQLHLSHAFSKELNVTGALHYTHGEGYYEQYRADDDFADYGLEDVTIGEETISSTDLIRRRWLDNDFIGGVFSVNYTASELSMTLGGGYNYYDGDHFGEIIWSEFASNSQIRDRYYDNYGRKKDFNIYGKVNYEIAESLNLFGDVQVRSINYETAGIDNDLLPINTGGDYTFLNPKFGATYFLNPESNLYASFAVGNREPVRNDFVDALGGEIPKHETLNNLEVGYRFNSSEATFSANVYVMDYQNQLVLTGALNDVGSGIRTNVDNSYRRGIELVGGYQVSDMISIGGNLTLSQNKIATFTEVVYDYGADFSEFNVISIEHEDTDIAFSPNVIAGGQIEFQPVQGLSIQFLGKYVGKQYLDNTSNADRIIRSYFVADGLLSYQTALSGLKQLTVSLMVNNLLNKQYESNGYTWGYYYGYQEGNLYQQNNYYPQAGTNFLLSLGLKF
ncbi:MAG: TonB-dependent receptor [Flammeovirgaceae bacterium]|nr:TonB-dependent receptor [Flammeovirgaceae bacterium]MBR06559.1 TonB-dependent receptor [Rickettsiales bacterium]HCX21115.1 TonB-dependent receptor [Cytophagales bacterium]|tara:strand:+ start:6864 stop:9326 length:2463 start_codon:yes stop_codon:yes gene_type:complete